MPGNVVSMLAGLVLLVAVRAVDANAQASTVRPAVRDSIVAVVELFFSAMEKRDTATLARIMLPDSRLTASRQRGDSTVIGGSSMADFLAPLPTMREVLRERMWNPQVLEHHGLAVLWAPYDFKIGDRFSHCGVDAFTLLRTPTGWRIAGVAYTVEVKGCPESPLGPP